MAWKAPAATSLLVERCKCGTVIKKTSEFSEPWLLRFFDQIRFYEVSEAELKGIRKGFPHGRYPLRIETGTFSLKEYEQFLSDNTPSIAEFTQKRDASFNEELARRVESGQINLKWKKPPKSRVKHWMAFLRMRAL